MNQAQQQLDMDKENMLKSAFFTIRDIHDPANKLESVKATLMDLIAEVQDGKFDMGGSN